MTQKEKVIAHVAQMVLTLGVKSVRMDDVAQSLGMSKRTLYEMFGDKEELIFESVKYHSERRAKEILSTLDYVAERWGDFDMRDTVPAPLSHDI